MKSAETIEISPALVNFHRQPINLPDPCLGECSRASAVGFTLIELVLVVAITCALAAMLLPALVRSKAMAKSAQCLSNLRQIGLGMSLYADQSNGLFPESGGLILWDQVDAQTQKTGWLQQIIAFTRNTNLYQCPAEQQEPFSYFNGARAAMVATANFASVDIRKIQFPAAHVLSGDTVWTDDGLADADKDDYSQNCVGGESNGSPATGWQVHIRGQNVLFSDYHVLWYKQYNKNEMTFRYDSMHAW